MIVIDTSVAAKWIFKGEKGALKAEKILTRHVLSREKVIVPDLFFYEIANILTTKTSVSLRKAINFLTKIYQISLILYRPNELDVKQATTLAKKYKTSVYDMLYAVIAKNHNTKLITADERFLEQTKFKFIELLKN